MDNGFLFFALLINFALSFVVANIAGEKGRSYWGFFWLSFLLSFFIAILVVLASPAKTQQFEVDNRLLVKCPYCAESILAEASVCRYCNKKVEPSLQVIEQVTAIDNDWAEFRAIKYKRTDKITAATFLFILAAAFLVLATAAVANSNVSQTGLIFFFVFLLLAGLCVLIAILTLRKMPKKPQIPQS